MAANETVVQDAYAAFGRGDIAAVIGALDETVEWTSPATLPQGGQFHGPDGVTKFFEAIGGAWSDLGLRVEAVTEAGDDLVIGVVRADGTLREKGKAGYGATHLFNVQSGKIVRFREYTDLDAPLL